MQMWEDGGRGRVSERVSKLFIFVLYICAIKYCLLVEDDRRWGSPPEGIIRWVGWVGEWMHPTCMWVRHEGRQAGNGVWVGAWGSEIRKEIKL